MNSQSLDDALIASLVAQEPAALDEFYRRYRLLVLSIARRIVVDEWDAEEVLQDVVWTAWRKAGELRPETRLKAWVAQVARNAALMLLRKRRRVPTPIEADDLESRLELAYDGQANRPDDLAASRQALARLGDALDKLDATNVDLFVSLEVAGEDRDEVAQRLGLSESALKSRLHRIRQTVKSAAPLAV